MNSQQCRDIPFVLLLQHGRECFEVFGRPAQRLLFLQRIMQIVTSHDLFDTEFNKRLGFAENSLELFEAVCLDHIRRVDPLFEEYHPSCHTSGTEHRSGFVGGVAPRFVSIICEDHFRITALENGYMVLRQCGSQRRDGVGKPRLVEHDHIQIPLCHDDLTLLHDGRFGFMVAVEQTGFVEDAGIGRVDVFGGMVGDGPPAETDDLAGRCKDGKSDALAEKGVGPATLATHSDKSERFGVTERNLLRTQKLQRLL